LSLQLELCNVGIEEALEALWCRNARVLKLVNGHVLVLQEALVVLLNIRGDLDSVDGSATPLLFYVGAEAQGLRPAARILPLVAAILELWLLRVVTAMEELAANEVRLANRALERD
jgi:hypothetical protein